MDKLTLPHAKLFYLISELKKNNQINENEKIKLKELVIKLDNDIFLALDNYLENNNLELLKENLLKLIK